MGEVERVPPGAGGRAAVEPGCRSPDMGLVRGDDALRRGWALKVWQVCPMIAWQFAASAVRWFAAHAHTTSVTRDDCLQVRTATSAGDFPGSGLPQA